MPLAAWRENSSRHVASLDRIRLAFFIASIPSAITGARLSGLRGVPKGRRGVTGYIAPGGAADKAASNDSGPGRCHARRVVDGSAASP
jgi:hypothetical protein